ncbi:MAG TPA: AAA family ATPase [Candidatus Magasanikbacteria bacterium]|nr:AAA family ATPase [Candidatus Magasanikbacteria bacterium]
MSSTQLLEEAREHIAVIQASLQKTGEKLEEQYKKMGQQYVKAEGAEKLTLHTLLQYTKKRQHELSALHPSPYFSRCNFNSEHKFSQVYIGKFAYSEESIVSWISPVATLRFSHPGTAEYIMPNREKRKVELTRKDEYLIKDGKVMFFATETSNAPRTLVYQENFSNRKTGFILPEIVSQMEEAQDRVIRSSWKGPMVISGPAGSGKTTLALHRVAYLMQVPEISEHFPGHRIKVFVQDNGTKSYFSSLLPELGIENVAIVTFTDWATDILGIDTKGVEDKRFDDITEDVIRHQKLRILRSVPDFPNDKPADWLYKVYKKHVTSHVDLVLDRLNQKVYDEVDLTIMLTHYKKQNKVLDETREFLVQQRNSFEVKRKKGKFQAVYNLCIIDEFQNYLPEQLQLIKGCVSEDTNAAVYVGDLRQQTKLGTLQSWNDFNEQIPTARHITLEKVYRNTKEILKFIQSLGYIVEIPPSLEEGKTVEVMSDTKETEEFINSFVEKNTDRLIGVLAKDESSLEPYQALKKCGWVKVMPVREAQGVEFDTVFLVGNTENTWSTANYPVELRKEKEKINRDLLYVALTRAMKELCVVGDIS